MLVTHPLLLLVAAVNQAEAVLPVPVLSNARKVVMEVEIGAGGMILEAGGDEAHGHSVGLTDIKHTQEPPRTTFRPSTSMALPVTGLDTATPQLSVPCLWGTSQTFWAVMLSLAAMVLTGSWGNACLVAQTRCEFFFFDYVIGNAAVCLLQAPTLIVTTCTIHASWSMWTPTLTLGFMAGVMYAVAVLFIMTAVELAGTSFIVPLAVCIEVLIGSLALLWIENATLSAWTHISVSLAAVMLAVLSDAVCHAWLRRAPGGEVPPLPPNTHSGPSWRRRRRTSWAVCERARRRNSSLSLFGPSLETVALAASGTQEALPAPRKDGTWFPAFACESFGQCPGIVLAALSGLCHAVWPCLMSVAEGRGHSQGLDVGPVVLEPVVAYATLVMGALATAFVVLPLLSRWPLCHGQPQWFWRGYSVQPMTAHALGLVGGVGEGIGLLLVFEAGELIGNSLAMSIVRCSPVVAALWGVCLWGDLDGAGGGAVCAFASMVVAFLVAVCVLCSAGLFTF
uniref:EamA domain-containing protein n=1 Tax=Pyrodinium bahamense TaxID=73915 RepID=A0A7S0B5Q5_9DINO|mmetsp:Transcript_51071/g.141427  ORF Transcript_51071/g.141427 Transcript_51071/m.141427 type:complete len:509 (+) Transcript_51071:61-1587(+)